MKWKTLIFILLICITSAACSPTQPSSQTADSPTRTFTPEFTISPTLTPTEVPTSTPTPIPDPEGQVVTDPLLRFSFFVPDDFTVYTGIYRYLYAFTTITQGDQPWPKAIALIDMDVTDQVELPTTTYLNNWLDNLEFAEVAVDSRGNAASLSFESYQVEAIDFTGSTDGSPVQGQIIGFKPDEDHVFMGVAWFDISEDPNIWETEGIHLFHFVLDSLAFEQ